jgi:hypothetical protein
MFLKLRRHGVRRDMHRMAQAPMMQQVSPVQNVNMPETVSPAHMNIRPERVSPVHMNRRPEPVSPAHINRRPEPVSPAHMNRRPEPVSPVEQVSPEQTGKNPPFALAHGRRPGFFRGGR